MLQLAFQKPADKRQKDADETVRSTAGLQLSFEQEELRIV